MNSVKIKTQISKGFEAEKETITINTIPYDGYSHDRVVISGIDGLVIIAKKDVQNLIEILQLIQL